MKSDNKIAEKWKNQMLLKQAFEELKKETGIDHRKILTGDKKERQRLKMKQYQEAMIDDIK